MHNIFMNYKKMPLCTYLGCVYTYCMCVDTKSDK